MSTVGIAVLQGGEDVKEIHYATKKGAGRECGDQVLDITYLYLGN